MAAEILEILLSEWYWAVASEVEMLAGLLNAII